MRMYWDMSGQSLHSLHDGQTGAGAGLDADAGADADAGPESLNHTCDPGKALTSYVISFSDPQVCIRHPGAAFASKLMVSHSLVLKHFVMH